MLRWIAGGGPQTLELEFSWETAPISASCTKDAQQLGHIQGKATAIKNFRDDFSGHSQMPHQDSGATCQGPSLLAFWHVRPHVMPRQGLLSLFERGACSLERLRGLVNSKVSEVEANPHLSNHTNHPDANQAFSSPPTHTSKVPELPLKAPSQASAPSFTPGSSQSYAPGSRQNHICSWSDTLGSTSPSEGHEGSFHERHRQGLLLR